MVAERLMEVHLAGLELVSRGFTTKGWDYQELGGSGLGLSVKLAPVPQAVSCVATSSVFRPTVSQGPPSFASPVISVRGELVVSLFSGFGIFSPRM